MADKTEKEINASISTFKKREKDLNPCHKEQALSYRCLSRNHYNNEKCVLQFENYKLCKTFWNKIRIERMFAGMEPMPDEEARKVIMAERRKGKIG